MKSAFEELQDRYRKWVPSSSLISSLATTPLLFTIQEWIAEFTLMTVSLESERVWPVPKPLLI
jgi:hypothetical protein